MREEIIALRNQLEILLEAAMGAYRFIKDGEGEWEEVLDDLDCAFGLDGGGIR